VLSGWPPTAGGQPTPAQSFNHITRNLPARSVFLGEKVLRGGDPGFGGASHPFDCNFRLAYSQVTLSQEYSQKIAGKWVSLLCGFLHQGLSIGKILRRSITTEISLAQQTLRDGVVLVGCFGQPSRSCVHVLGGPPSIP